MRVGARSIWFVVGALVSLASGCGESQDPPGPRPAAGTDTSDAGTDTSDAGTDAPDAGTDTPDAGTDTSDAGTDTSDAGTDAPDAGTDAPDAGTDTSDAGTDTPDAGTTTPFSARFTDYQGNNWWIEVRVSATAPPTFVGWVPAETPDAPPHALEPTERGTHAGSGVYVEDCSELRFVARRDGEAHWSEPVVWPPGTSCDGSGEGLPDLRVSAERLEDTWFLEWQYFNENSCAWVEHCLNGTGWRLLLRFATEIQNVGTADLRLGEPEGNDDFEWAGCHHHYHLRSSTDQELLDGDGTVVAVGLKQGFCWTDNVEVPDFPSQPRKYAYHGEDSCNVVQGLTVGWADLYKETLDCQWIDVTGVPAGPYTLRVYANPQGLIEELDYRNNVAEIDVTLDPPPRPE